MKNFVNPIAAAGAAEQRLKAAGFAQYVRLLMSSKELGEVERRAEADHRGLVQSLAKNRLALKLHFENYLTKAAVAPANSDSALGDYTDASDAFLESVGAYGAFDAMYPSMRPVPIKANIVTVTAAGVANTTSEASLKKISRLSMEAQRLEPTKIVAFFCMSDELAKFSGTRGAALFRAELAKAVAAATDAEFISRLASGLTPTASAGSTIDALRTDLRNALMAVESDDASQLFLLMSSDNAKAIALLDGGTLLQNFGVNGGSLAGMRVAITDAASTNLILVDANQLAADRGLLLPSQTNQATLQFSDLPDSPQTASSVVINLWQNNLQAVRLERFFAVERLRLGAVAVISNANYGSISSP